jgi:hypothetical protein
MNLFQVLNYHSKCLICHQEMEIKSPELAGITITQESEGLLVQALLRKIAVIFRYDGTYEKLPYFGDLYLKPLRVMKECPNCIPSIMIDGKKTPVKLKSRSVGATTMFDVESLRFCYEFELFGQPNPSDQHIKGDYTAALVREDIKYNNEKGFYHLTTQEKESNLWYGRTKPTEEDSNWYANTCRLTLPAIDTSGLDNIEQLISKMQIYNLFS